MGRSNSPALGRSPERERTLSLERVASPPLVTPPHESGGGFEVLPDMDDSDLDYDPEKPGALDTGEPLIVESSKQQSDKERPETPQKSVRFKSLSKDSDEKSSTLYKGLDESKKSPKKSDAKKPSTDSPRIENPFAFIPRTVTETAEPAGVTRTIDAA